MWIGMAPVFAKASLQAIFSGPRRKPVYRVTRKQDDTRWHWQYTLPQATIVAATVTVAVYALRFGTFPDPILLLGTVYWGGLNIVLLTNFVARGWHGLDWTRTVLGRETAAPSASRAE
jgi:cellulose synthase (UDP-forming)